MKQFGSRLFPALLFVCWSDISVADTAKSIPLDRQVDLNLPQKDDPLIKKEEVQKKPAEVKNISYDGVWKVVRLKDACKSGIGDFKIKIDGQSIVTVIGMNVEGSLRENGTFAMSAKSKYWSIKFNGSLGEKSGRGRWTKTDNENSECSGSIALTRVGE